MSTRTEVNENDTWNVKAFYPSNEAWEEEFSTVVGQDEPRWPELVAFRGRLGEGPGVMCEVLDFFFGLERVLSRLFVYAHLRNDEDLTQDEHKGMYQRAASLCQLFGQEASWIEPELLSLSEETLESYLASSELAGYKRYLERVVRQKPHTRSAEEEELIAMAGQAMTAPHRAFGALENADFDFGSVEDSEEVSHELTLGSYQLFLRSPDRILRENAFKRLQGHFEDYENTICELLNGQLQAHRFQARSHAFGSCLESALFPFNIDPAVYHNLIQTVRKRLPILHRYLNLRKRVMGVDELHLYDMYVPLIEDEQSETPYDQAAAWVIESVAPLGEEYQKTLSEGMLQHGWVDRYENDGKRSGAYSSGCFDSMPYILMNYKGTLNDVFTLAHEAGHSMHSFLSHKHQPYQYGDYPIFVAEVASTFNEELLMRLLLDKAETKERRIYLINQKLEGLRATLFRQTMFAEFELLLHEMVEGDIPLTPATLKEKYLELNALYFGPEAHIDPEIAIEWARIPHFYYNFYVYQYATGISAAEALAQRVHSGGEAERDAYLAFLSGGSSEDPIDLLKMAGVDMRQPAPVEAAIAVFERLTAELEILMAPVG